MTNPLPTQHALRHCSGGRAERGSAIVLVLVSMVLMAILAGSLLQLTRFERIPRSESNIEIVIESVIAEILNQATDDLIDINGDFLNARFTSTNGGADEPWDYPWTNFNRVNTAANHVRSTEQLDGTTVYPHGGVMDDAWLADHMPDFRLTAQVAAGSLPNASGVFNNTNGVWRKITSLNGLYLGGTSGSADLSTVATPNEYLVNFSGPATNRDMNFNLANAQANLLVDADGDGIGDSRWEWAPLRQIGGTQYVMAVRIVDLSARMDMNVSTGRFNTTTASLSRGDSPAEINGQQFVESASTLAGLNTTTTTSEYLSVLNYHLTSNASPGATTPIGAAAATLYDNNNASPSIGSRRHHWTEGASRVSNRFSFNGEDPAGATYDYSAGFFGLTDAFELLQGNGVNSANTTTIENLMPVFLRRGGQEDNYAIGSINGWTQRLFWQRDPRKHISMFTGSGEVVKPVNVGRDRDLKIDVNEAVKTGPGRTALRTQIDTFLNTNGAPLIGLYQHLTTADEFANQLTANIADYIDDDNTVTPVGNQTGFEALPYISEVYTQRIYDGTVVASGTAGTNNVTWASTFDQGYAIEIGNPFSRFSGGSWVGRPISLDNVYLSFDGGTTTQELSGIAGIPSELQPGEVIYLYNNSTGNGTTVTDDALNQASSYYTAIAPSTNYANVFEGQGPAMPTTAGTGTDNVTVSLHATLQDTAAAAGWAYNACDIQIGLNTLSDEAVPDTDFTVGTAYQTYVQTHYQGHGEGLRMMTVVADPAATNGYYEDIASLTTPSNNSSSGATGTGEALRPTAGYEFANESKANAPTGFASIDGAQIVWPDSERNRMHWIGDILQIPLIGPDRTAGGNATTMAQTFATANSASSIDTNGMVGLYLPYQAGTTVVNTNTAQTANTGRFGIHNYPHAVLLLEQLTTFNPATDGEDGDGQNETASESLTNEDLDEVLVPGRINLNTAPEETLVRLLPFPDLTTRQAVAKGIITRRESLVQANAIASNGYGMGANDIPGIAYTAALFEQLSTLPDGTPTGYTNTSTDSADSVTLGGSRIDLNDHETALGTFVSNDGVIDDREEELMLAKWLTEVADTRSDVFAAYIVVQGYPADNFSGGADESARLIIIFSRSNVEGAGDKAVEIGRFRIN